MWKTQIQFLRREDSLEKGMATQSSILAWRIPWTEEPVGYSPWGHKESDVTEWLTLHFQVHFIGCLPFTEGPKIIFYIILEGNDQYMADVDSMYVKFKMIMTEIFYL